MSATFLSQSWYRVAGTKPALASHVRAHRHRYLGQAWYVLEDTVTGKSHRISPSAYAVAGRLDGRRSIDAIWLEVAALAAEPPSQDDVITLLAQLHQADLLRADTAPDIAELTERHSRQVRTLRKQNLMNPASIRLPLFDPDRLLGRALPWLRPLIGPAGLVLWALLVIPALFLAARHWAELTDNVADRVLSYGNLAILLITYPLVKALHEFGHGIVAKRYGAAVNETGLMFLVGFPVPYVDATGASAFRSKWRRAGVGAAGIIVETGLGAIALYLWALLEPGFERALCYNIILIGGVSTVLVNGNPLLRFDGYYILADLLEMPNLAQRANRYLKHLLDNRAFGLDDPKPFQATTREKLLFLAYAPASYVYRFLLMVSIATFVAQRYFILGVLAGLWMVLQSLVLPLLKGVGYLLTSPQLRRVRRRTLLVSGAALAAALALLFVLPMPSWTIARGIVWLPPQAQLRAGTSGFFKSFAVAADARVGKGAPIALFEEPALDAHIDTLSWKVRELELKLAANIVNDRVLAQTTRIELDEARAQLAREEMRRAHLTVSAEIDGRFVPALPPQDAPGRFFKEGDLVGNIVPDRPSVVRVVVEQDAIDRVRLALESVEIRPDQSPSPAFRSTVLRAVPAGQFELPGPALSTLSGGPIVTDPRDAKGQTALARVFQLDLALGPEASAVSFGGRVHVKFDHGYEPAGFQIWRRLRTLFLSAFNA